MSAAAARRRKQLLARSNAEKGGDDAVAAKLQKLLDGADDEPTAYEGLQLAQSQVRKAVHGGNFDEGTTLAYKSSLTLLQKKKVSVASQLLHLLVDVLRETHTEPSAKWLDRISELHAAHEACIKDMPEGTTETNRLVRLQREFLRKCVSWSAELGTIRFGNPQLLELLGNQSWLVPASEDEDRISIMSDAVQAMALAEKPDQIVAWLKTMPKPTKAQLANGHTCPPGHRDALLTRAILLLLAVENIRDASILFRAYMTDIEERTVDELTKSYMNKTDGKAPSHLIFCSMMLCICQKDTRTGPLFTWLMRSFKREMDLMEAPKPQVLQSYCTKIGKTYFNIQPPPSMMSMMENMMGMMGGGGGMNPAMMQAALAGGM